MSNIVIDYLYGYMPLGEQVFITLLWLVPAFAIWLYRRRKVIISQEINGGGKADTPYVSSSPKLPRGNFILWCWEIARDTFINYWYYNSFTVWRLKKEGKADWRQYVVKPVQMQTINWDNCTYNVCEDCMIPVRGGSVMLVIEGNSEPIKIKYLFFWERLLKKVSDCVNKDNYDVWDIETQSLVGEWKPDAYLFYSKMNNRNTQKIQLAGVPDLQLMFYAVIGTLLLTGLIYASINGWIGSDLQNQFEAIKAGMVQLYQAVKK